MNHLKLAYDEYLITQCSIALEIYNYINLCIISPEKLNFITFSPWISTSRITSSAMSVVHVMPPKYVAL